MWWKHLIFHYFSQGISDCCFLRSSFGFWKQTFSFWYHYLASERVKTWKCYISVHFVRKQSKSQKFRLLPTPSTITTVVGDTISGHRGRERSTVVGDRDDLRSLATTTIRDRRFCSLRSWSLLGLNDPWSLKRTICGSDPRFTIVIDDHHQWSTIVEKDGFSGLRTWVCASELESEH